MALTDSQREMLIAVCKTYNRATLEHYTQRYETDCPIVADSFVRYCMSIDPIALMGDEYKKNEAEADKILEIFHELLYQSFTGGKEAANEIIKSQGYCLGV